MTLKIVPYPLPSSKPIGCGPFLFTNSVGVAHPPPSKSPPPPHPYLIEAPKLGRGGSSFSSPKLGKGGLSLPRQTPQGQIIPLSGLSAHRSPLLIGWPSHRPANSVRETHPCPSKLYEGVLATVCARCNTLYWGGSSTPFNLGRGGPPTPP